MSGVRHLYVHLPFCAHRCGYCDFVTVVGRRGLARGVRRRAARRARARARTSSTEQLETVYLGGGTPTFTEPAALERLLDSLPAAAELTVEANPETVTPALARLLSRNGVNRVSIGAQSFDDGLLSVLERRARPDDVRRAVHTFRDANIDNISLDLIYGIPGQSPSDLARDLDEALALEPQHLSCYELEAKPGTRFTHTFGDELARQSEALEGYFEQVVDTLTAAGYRWYETANFCRRPEDDGGRDLRSRHNLAYWLGRDYLGLGIGAVSTVGSVRWKNTPRLPAYLESLGERARVRRGRSSRSTTTSSAASASCSGCASTSRSRSRASRPRSTSTALDRLERLGLALARRRRDADADPARSVARRRRDGRAAGVKCLHTCKSS